MVRGILIVYPALHAEPRRRDICDYPLGVPLRIRVLPHRRRSKHQRGIIIMSLREPRLHLRDDKRVRRQRIDIREGQVRRADECDFDRVTGRRARNGRVVEATGGPFLLAAAGIRFLRRRRTQEAVLVLVAVVVVVGADFVLGAVGGEHVLRLGPRRLVRGLMLGGAASVLVVAGHCAWARSAARLGGV